MTSTLTKTLDDAGTTNASLGLAIPIVPGRTPAVRALLADCMGSRRAEFAASRRRAGIARDQKWIQTTPVGDFLVRYVEADDARAAVSHVLASDHPFDVWYRGELQQLTAAPLASLGLAPKLVLDFDVAPGEAGAAVAFVVPILPGKEKDNLAFAKTLTLADPGYAELTRKATVLRERVWQHESPGGSFSVLWFEARDPGQAFQAWGADASPFARYLRERILAIHGVDLSQPAAPPELVLSYAASV